jgi:hypothetical protein
MFQRQFPKQGTNTLTIRQARRFLAKLPEEFTVESAWKIICEKRLSNPTKQAIYQTIAALKRMRLIEVDRRENNHNIYRKK